MQFYIHVGDMPLGSEPCGTDGKLLFKLKTLRGAINRGKAAFVGKTFTVYSYSNFYDSSTFFRMHTHYAN